MMKKKLLKMVCTAIVLFLGASFCPLAANSIVQIEEVQQQDKGFYIEVTGNGVRGRLGPGTNYQDTGVRFYKGQRLKVFGQRNGWYEVRSGQETVWISGQFAKRSKKQTPDYVSVAVDEPVKLFLSPGGKDSGLRVGFEEKFKYLGEQGNWYKISHNGKVYWISKDYSYAE